MKRKFGLIGMLLTAFLLLAGLKVDAAPPQGVDWNTQTITVIGTGVPPTNAASAAQARVLARRAAIADAYRHLAETVHGVHVDAQTTVEDMMTSSDVVRLKVEAVIKGAQILDEHMAPDGAYEVTMTLPVFGKGGFADAVIPRPERVESFPEPQPMPSTKITITVEGVYTGLVIDCRGLRVNPVMSPVIKNANGQKIYGHENLDYDRIIDEGMVSYADSLRNATRAGANPLVIKAERMDDFNANPVVSVADANRILQENKVSGFLGRTAVVFLY